MEEHQGGQICDLLAWIHWSFSTQRARQLWTRCWKKSHKTHLHDRNGEEVTLLCKHCSYWDSGHPWTQKEDGRKSRLDEEPSQPKLCNLDEGQIYKQKWEKWKSSASKKMQQNDGRRQRMSWIRKTWEDLRLLRFLSPEEHLDHLTEKSSKKARTYSGQDRLKMLTEFSHRGIEI